MDRVSCMVSRTHLASGASFLSRSHDMPSVHPVPSADRLRPASVNHAPSVISHARLGQYGDLSACARTGTASLRSIRRTAASGRFQIPSALRWPTNRRMFPSRLRLDLFKSMPANRWRQEMNITIFVDELQCASVLDNGTLDIAINCDIFAVAVFNKHRDVLLGLGHRTPSLPQHAHWNDSIVTSSP